MEVESIPQAYTSHACACNHSVEKPREEDPLTKCSTSDDAAPAPSMNGCFDCNICLDFVVDPVVTLCGHLYCWPCIYKWMQVEGKSHQQCPVCKAFLSEDTLVPLYGRGGHGTKEDSDVPSWPKLHRHRDHSMTTSVQQPMQQPQFNHHYYHRHHYPSSASLDNSYMSDPSSPLIAPLYRSTAGGVLGGLAIAILPWVFGNHGMSMYHANPYFLTLSGNSPRLRRQQIQVESSLHQIWLFLFCCAILCLLFF